MNNIILDENGKPKFVGQEDPNNPPVKPVGEGSKSECPVCHSMVDYLVGEDTPDGGRQGCEGCWRPSQQPISRSSETYDTSKDTDNI